MIQKFSTQNFKGFKDRIDFDLSTSHDYHFHSDYIINNICNKNIIFGKNGTGKSNIGKAIMDVSRHLTDNLINYDSGPYKNMNSLDKPVYFYYMFKFDNDIIEYEYYKDTPTILLSEKLSFNNKEVLFCDFINKIKRCSIPESEKLDYSEFKYQMSLCKFLKSRAGYVSGSLFDKFYDFVNRMLFFRSLKQNEFEGYSKSGKLLADIILEHGKEDTLDKLEKFLAKEGLFYNLDISLDYNNNKNVLYAVYDKEKVPLLSICSTGTQSLILFFCWLLELENTSFLFLDEFDAFYHYELSIDILHIVYENPKFQTIVTTHNCSLMNNKETRPDCCYLIFDNKNIKNIKSCTTREIREGHNLENLYKNGAFSN